MLHVGAAAELALTARVLPAAEAVHLGLVTRCYSNHQELLDGVLATARVLAAKPQLAVRGTKRVLLHAR